MLKGSLHSNRILEAYCNELTRSAEHILQNTNPGLGSCSLCKQIARSKCATRSHNMSGTRSCSTSPSSKGQQHDSPRTYDSASFVMHPVDLCWCLHKNVSDQHGFATSQVMDDSSGCKGNHVAMSQNPVPSVNIQSPLKY